ncbi:MAG TPA: NAD(P)-dependent oxidoreductase [Gaiellales bacterium]|jgi:3-hydroxyisobutyrate dehydrogenase-like beta-hydroxyacid dehydrogenase|nr:NAD(P)-dependent oxidoreductase [Gaiellales bacterium]
MRVALVGLGTMGAPMARHLLEAGHQVTVHNRTREREEPLAGLGAARAATPREAASAAEAVLTCVSDTPDLLAVLEGEQGVAAGLERGGLVIDCSTVSPAETAAVAERLAGRGIGFVDAPVSGGSEGAERGTLTVFAGGEEADVERARPILEAFSGRITHLGPPGAGQVAKAVNQVMIAGTYASVGEGIALARAAGLPAEALVQALAAGAAASWVLDNRSANMIADSYPLGFKVGLHRKDLGIALDEAARLGLSMAVAKLVAEQEDGLIADGHGDEDVSALARLPRGSTVPGTS